MITVVCCLFKSDRAPKTGGSAGWGLYTPEWADKLYRGVKRNLVQPFRFVCVTDARQDEFRAPIEAVPFRMSEHAGAWMCINEVFRPDLDIDRGLFMGLDTVIISPFDDLVDELTGPIYFTLSQETDPPLERSRARPADFRNVREVCNAVTFFRRPAAAELWDKYQSSPKEHSDASIAEWSEGLGSEMVFWREQTSYNWGTIPPGRAVSRRNFKDHPRASFVYFHGSAKPGPRMDPLLRKNWQ